MALRIRRDKARLPVRSVSAGGPCLYRSDPPIIMPAPPPALRTASRKCNRTTEWSYRHAKPCHSPESYEIMPSNSDSSSESVRRRVPALLWFCVLKRIYCHRARDKACLVSTNSDDNTSCLTNSSRDERPPSPAHFLPLRLGPNEEGILMMKQHAQVQG